MVILEIDPPYLVTMSIKPYSAAGGAQRAAAAHEPAKVKPRGKAVQVEPMKPVLKLLGTKILIPKCGELLSRLSFAFNLNLRRYR